MAITIIKGNILDTIHLSNIQILVHGCNCFHTMGGGIALQIKNMFPESYFIDLETVYGLPEKLGKISYTIKQTNPIIVNAYTQYGYSIKFSQVDYNAIRSCMKEIKKIFHNKIISMPMIGAGLAGGNWDIILSIIKDELYDENVIIVIYNQEPNVDNILVESQNILNNSNNIINTNNIININNLSKNLFKSKIF